jgi:hypothetical protein
LALGGSVSGSCSRALLSADDFAARQHPDLFDTAQHANVAALAELIIPTTETPGAIAAGVPDFIHRIVAQWYTADERAEFLAGLKTLKAASRAHYRVDFAGASDEQRSALLCAFEGAKPDSAERAFFLRVKELTVLGYYTSEIGGQQELLYRPVPGAYHGHAMLGAHARQWTQ